MLGPLALLPLGPVAPLELAHHLLALGHDLPQLPRAPRHQGPHEGVRVHALEVRRQLPLLAVRLREVAHHRPLVVGLAGPEGGVPQLRVPLEVAVDQEERAEREHVDEREVHPQQRGLGPDVRERHGVEALRQNRALRRVRHRGQIHGEDDGAAEDGEEREQLRGQAHEAQVHGDVEPRGGGDRLLRKPQDEPYP